MGEIATDIKERTIKMEEKICQSCGMPMKNEKDYGTNEDNSLNMDYCYYCFQKGKFVYDCDMNEMIEHNLKFLNEFNKDAKTTFNEEQAKVEMLKFFPTLKRWKHN